ncbi:hypothetical protein Q8P09_12500 [Psychrobacter faecalis]|uniref:Peptidase S74 domain-containing protein n=1 Tax=Psychrobacter faecalis TaxID=180588 RepID=A0ABT9HJD8_9GAMM|nr:hypothetical protein [Psychrobacter faecalis]MDP4545896.1 hypothetical protein [Psychrobacter faecalis]
MAVQIPDPGTGNGQTGDNEYVFRKKVKDNFSDQTNAASKLVGAEAGRIPLSNQVRAAMLTSIDGDSTTSPDGYTNGTAWYVNGATTPEGTPQGFSSNRHIVESRYLGSGKTYQRAYGWNTLDAAHRLLINSVWTEWQPLGWNKKNYNTTTAAGANAVIDIDGRIIRSTSSERYKDILSPLELDDARYADAMALKPIVYRSTADADNPAYHFYSFSAEELGASDPAFTLWRETETVIDDKGNSVEQPLVERQAEGININALLAMSHAIAIKQDSLIKALEARIEILEAK